MFVALAFNILLQYLSNLDVERSPKRYDEASENMGSSENMLKYISLILSSNV